MRHKQPYMANFLTGLLIGFIFMSAAPARAQFPGPAPVVVISDTSPHAVKSLIESTKQTIAQIELVKNGELSTFAQLAEYAKQAERWIATVKQYSDVIIGDAKRFTSLKGILSIAEEQAGLDDDKLQALADIGQAVRGCLAVKKQYEALLQTRLTMIKSIETRARNGIFDPTADVRDLEDYLQNSIGKSAENVLATRERLAQQDAELERWSYELERLRAELANKQIELKSVADQLEKEGALGASVGQATVADTGDRTKPRLKTRETAAAEALNNLTQRKLLLDGQINDLNKQISELIEKITARYKQYHIHYDEAKRAAIRQENGQQAWERMNEVKADVIKKAFDQYGSDVPILNEK